MLGHRRRRWPNITPLVAHWWCLQWSRELVSGQQISWSNMHVLIEKELSRMVLALTGLGSARTHPTLNPHQRGMVFGGQGWPTGVVHPMGVNTLIPVLSLDPHSAYHQSTRMTHFRYQWPVNSTQLRTWPAHDKQLNHFKCVIINACWWCVHQIKYYSYLNFKFRFSVCTALSKLIFKLFHFH